MSIGPIVAGLGLLGMLRVGANPSYLTAVLPAICVFGIGLSATVAPLTATVLDSVQERHVGVASGVNNGISRVAGLLAIAVLGAVISAHFGSALDSELGGLPLSHGAREDISAAKEQPLGRPKTAALVPAQAARIDSAATAASTAAFHLGIAIAALLMVIGGVVAAFGIEDPRRSVAAVPTRGAAAAGECGHGADADCAEVGSAAEEAAEPEPA